MSIKRYITTMLLACMAMALTFAFNGKISFAKDKTICIEAGDTVKLPLKNAKSYKYRCNKKSIVKIKNGKITALKKGKCIVKVFKGKKITRYKVVVKNKKKNAKADSGINNNATEVNSSSSPEPTSKPQVDWSKIRMPISFGIYKVYDITEIDDLNNRICFVRKDDSPYTLFDSYNVEYIMVDIQKSVLNNADKPINIGDNASFIFYHDKGKWLVKDNTLYISDLDIISIHNENREDIPESTMPPTPPPVANNDYS